eukprot:gnl/MRDRNA2_/MRDRNA2_116955_c0_seq1.p1 gnl/MRDRNA2_/MRDRNA2_116955_c0~~gnl/MRDRNA2_/MRDRNA2_116955_c0_seq1.p1  ORF type:complete len:116 (-),score=17.92 gnl/MRDRNA2_/MRDRNA2_116955_c0_seq1:44-391(-)
MRTIPVWTVVFLIPSLAKVASATLVAQPDYGILAMRGAAVANSHMESAQAALDRTKKSIQKIHEHGKNIKAVASDIRYMYGGDGDEKPEKLIKSGSYQYATLACLPLIFVWHLFL